MDITNDSVALLTRDYLIAKLKSLLADEYVLMNRTSNYISDLSSPFYNSNNNILSIVYEDLKRNAEELYQFLKCKTEKAFLSIDEIFSNTQIKKGTLVTGKVEVIEMLMADNLLINKTAEEAINEFAFTSEKDCVPIFKKLRDNHQKISKKFKGYLQDIINYKQKEHDQKL